MEFPWLTEEMPDELAMSIFLKLPVKSLIRFRSVSKSISAAVQSPDFIASHQEENRDRQILVQLSRSSHRDNRPNFTTLSSDFHPQENIQMPFWEDSFEYPVVSGSCNGLLCLSSRDQIVIWNPSTRELKHVPPSTIQRPRNVVRITFGRIDLWCDDKSGEYKLIRYITNHVLDNFCPFDDELDWINQVEIYCLNSNSWREICHPNTFASRLTTFGDLENGLFNWRGTEAPRQGIISFDFINESFTEIAPPEFGEEDYQWRFVERSDGPMTLIAYPFHGENRVFDLWVNKNGWIKELNFGPLSGIKSPLGTWIHGKLFFESKDGELLLIDVQTGEMKNFGIFAKPRTLHVILYVESLVPVYGETEQRQGILREIIHQ